MAWKNKETVEIVDFSGGMNSVTDLLSVKMNQNMYSRNIMYDEVGAIQARYGYSTLNSTPIVSSKFDGLFSYRPNTMSAQILAICNSNLHVITGAGTALVTVGSSESIFTTGNQVNFIQFQDLVFMGNGGQKPYKFNGREFTQMGVSAPASASVTTNGERERDQAHGGRALGHSPRCSRTPVL